MSLMMDAIEWVAKLLPDKPVDPMIAADRVVGRAMSRLDGPAKVTGQARYTGEIRLADLAHGTLVCSTIAKGSIASIDTSVAEAAPGVIGILTYRNAPKMVEAPLLLTMKGASFTRLPVLQDNGVRWNGEPLALVVAETKEQADHAASLVRVTYAPSEARLDFEAFRATAERPTDVLGQPSKVESGDAEGALKTSSKSVDNIYSTPRHNHAALELHACTAEWHDAASLTLYDTTQAVTLTRATLAKVFGLKEKNVRVISDYVGGAFGNKMAWNHQLLCAAAAQLVKRPVRLVLSREDVFATTGGRTPTHQRVALGCADDGSLDALIHTGVTSMGRKNGFAEQISFPARHIYASRNYFIEQRIVELDTVANASMRAPGESVGGFALESALDELAYRLGVDPIMLRRRNQPDRDPVKKNRFSARNLLAAYELGEQRFDWARRADRPRATRDGDWLVGQGVATAFYPYQRFPGAEASIRITADGRAVVRTSAHEMGMGTATAQTQLAAERLGLPIEMVRFEYGDSTMPTGVPAGGSAQTASIIASVHVASEALFKALLKLASPGSPLRGKRVKQVEARDGGLFIKGSGEGETYAAILAKADQAHLEAHGTGSMPLEMMKYSMHSYGAQFCEARVNEVTGEVRIARWLGVFDTGRIINPKTAASQFRGGIVMGLGAALTEEAAFDARYGRVINPSLAEYHVPVHADVPDLDVAWLDIPDPLAPMGAKGVGEIGITGVAAAVANAVFHATGKRIRDLPLTPDKILFAPVQA